MDERVQYLAWKKKKMNTMIWKWARKKVYPQQWPKKSDLLFYRWNKQSDKYLDEEIQLLRKSREQQWGKKHDEYARAFNASKDAEERFSLAVKMDKCCQEMKKNMEAFQANDKKQAKLDRLYKQYESARKKE